MPPIEHPELGRICKSLRHLSSLCLYSIYSMTDPSITQSWFNRVRHDLVKPLLWRARDYREMDQKPPLGSLSCVCINEEGERISPIECWSKLREEAPLSLELHEFESALKQAVIAAVKDDVDGVLSLEHAFARLLTQDTSR
jgi:hypothetical protein